MANNVSISKWPELERPRERLLALGQAAVSDAGLVAILLRTGVKGQDAVAFARDLLTRFGGVRGLLHAGKEELGKVKGIGPAKRAQLLAALELMQRCLREEIIQKRVISSPADVTEYLCATMGHLKTEEFRVIFLNRKNEILALESIAKGTVDQAAVYPREVIKRVLELGASGLIFVHNHPSGNLDPSQDDLKTVRSLDAACLAVGISVLDHLVVSNKSYKSIK
ncbi:MAG: DNA repair protein RadC [Elusimicrobia bacterium]|nr:DNA repair protein RadC [Elusimicrobiota bacterium]